ncbi:MAG: YihY/virulence factor BrkB family protein, partial [Actinomycetia bacterium]|nr:YihY/virulence factor BrkB family protein [Actinomycetes bacterium]
AWRQDRTMRLGAGLAYYALFTIVPLVLLTIALGARILDNQDVEAYIAEGLAGITGVDPDRVATSLTDELSRRAGGPSMGVVGFVTLLLTSSLVFLALVDAIDAIWHMPVKSGMRETVRRRLMAFLLVLATGGVVIASFALSAVAGAAEAAIPGDIPALDQLATLISSLASSVVLALALTLLLRFLSPDPLLWRIALPVGAITSILLTAGTWLLGWYMRTWGAPSIPGTFGAMLLTLTWIYYEAQIILVGVQLSKVLTSRIGSGSSSDHRSPG